jgi:hypothetical protein
MLPVCAQSRDGADCMMMGQGLHDALPLVMVGTCAAAVRHVPRCCFLCLQYTSRAAQLYRQQLEKESIKTFRCAAVKAAEVGACSMSYSAPR